MIFIKWNLFMNIYVYNNIENNYTKLFSYFETNSSSNVATDIIFSTVDNLTSLTAINYGNEINFTYYITPPSGYVNTSYSDRDYCNNVVSLNTLAFNVYNDFFGIFSTPKAVLQIELNSPEDTALYVNAITANGYISNLLDNLFGNLNYFFKDIAYQFNDLISTTNVEQPTGATPPNSLRFDTYAPPSYKINNNIYSVFENLLLPKPHSVAVLTLFFHRN